MNPTELPRNSSEVVYLDDEPAVEVIVQNTILGLWEIVNNLTRMKPSKTPRYRVTIFGSARCQPGTPPYEETRRAAESLAAMGCDIITGGGPGLMQAANEGAVAAGAPEQNRSVGIRVDLPFEQGANAFVRNAFLHRTFFTRLHHFVLASDAFLVAPGGIGTLLETAMVWQLLQVGHIDDVPLILMGPMWPDLVAWAEKSMITGSFPMAKADDMRIPVCVPTAAEAVEIIRGHHARWLAEGNGKAGSDNPAKDPTR